MLNMVYKYMMLDGTLSVMSTSRLWLIALLLDGLLVQCKRTGSRSQFRAGVGPLLPLESDLCLAFLQPVLMVRAIPLHYATRMPALHCTMERIWALRERQTHQTMAGLWEGEEPRRHGQTKEEESASCRDG